MHSQKKMAFIGYLGILLATVFCSHPAFAGNACDTTNFGHFFVYQGQTYALTAQPATWDQTSQTATAAGGNLAIIADAPQNAAITSGLAASFSASPAGTKEAWIGLSDPNATPNYCIDGQTTPCTPDPQRFQWVSGSSSFVNWSSSQPDNHCTVAERNANPNFACYGENWAAMQADGTWADEGDHGPTPLKLTGIVAWPTILDCVVPTTPPASTQGNTLDPSAGLWCASQNKASFQQCLTTTTGGSICPADKVACNAVLDTPICPTGTSLNASSHSCQADPTITCTAGGTPLGLDCQQDYTISCPSGYTPSADQTQCVATQICPSGTYSSVTNRCEVPQSATTAYSTPTASVSSITKYEPRNYTASTIGQFWPSSAGIQDVVSFTFGVADGKVVVESECAWGGKGNCGCGSPNWNNDCGGYTDIAKTYNGTTLTASATMIYGFEYNQDCCTDPSFPTLVSSSDPDAGDTSYCTGTGMVWTQCDDGLGDGLLVPCQVPATQTVQQCLAWSVYTGKYGATAMADISEFQKCPAGTTTIAPLTTATCTAIYSVWGRATGVSDCTNPGQYTCSKATTACPVGQTLSTTGNCILDSVNPYCPPGNGQVTIGPYGGNNYECLTPVIQNCPAGTQINSAGTQCVGGGQIVCPQDTGFNGVPVNKCEATPTCANGLFIAGVNACYNQQQTCPTGNFTCSSIQGDTTQSTPGIPMQYCSPDACTADTTSQLTNTDTPSGANDIKADGTKDANGNCTGAIYFFNGTDNRCIKEDDRTSIVAITKLVAQIAASCVLGPGGAFLVSMATTVLGDAALGNLGTSTLMAVGFSAVSYGLQAYGGPLMDSLKESMSSAWTTLSTSLNGVDQLATTVPLDTVAPVTSGMSGFNDWVTNQVTSHFDVSGADVASLTNTLETRAPGVMAAATNDGMLSSFTPKKCCYPDALSSSCLPAETTEAAAAKAGLCHKVGTYCTTHWLTACVTTKETSCCYDSILSRIIAEQGRPLLQSFNGIANGGFGTAESPVCRGYKPEEFQQIDMRKINFSEYIDQVATNSAAQIQGMLQNAGSQFKQSQTVTPATP